MNKPTGGAAFPSRGGMMFYVPETARGEIEKAVTALDQQHSGLSLRDYFAGKALQGVVRKMHFAENIAEAAYEIADAMLAERDK